MTVAARLPPARRVHNAQVCIRKHPRHGGGATSPAAFHRWPGLGVPPCVQPPVCDSQIKALVVLSFREEATADQLGVSCLPSQALGLLLPDAGRASGSVGRGLYPGRGVRLLRCRLTAPDCSFTRAGRPLPDPGESLQSGPCRLDDGSGGRPGADGFARGHPGVLHV